GCARSRSAASPPTMTVSFSASAPDTPPLTGASRKPSPFSARPGAVLRAVAAAANAAALAAVRFQTESVKAGGARCLAMGAPMAPRPKNAMLGIPNKLIAFIGDCYPFDDCRGETPVAREVASGETRLENRVRGASGAKRAARGEFERRER